MLFIDDCTKFVWIYFMTQISEVYQLFLNFRTMVKTQFSCDIKSMQSDWGESIELSHLFLLNTGLLIESHIHTLKNKMWLWNVEIELLSKKDSHF